MAPSSGGNTGGGGFGDLTAFIVLKPNPVGWPSGGSGLKAIVGAGNPDGGGGKFLITGVRGDAHDLGFSRHGVLDGIAQRRHAVAQHTLVVGLNDGQRQATPVVELRCNAITGLFGEELRPTLECPGIEAVRVVSE